MLVAEEIFHKFDSLVCLISWMRNSFNRDCCKRVELVEFGEVKPETNLVLGLWPVNQAKGVGRFRPLDNPIDNVCYKTHHLLFSRLLHTVTKLKKSWNVSIIYSRCRTSHLNPVRFYIKSLFTECAEKAPFHRELVTLVYKFVLKYFYPRKTEEAFWTFYNFVIMH